MECIQEIQQARAIGWQWRGIQQLRRQRDGLSTGSRPWISVWSEWVRGGSYALGASTWPSRSARATTCQRKPASVRASS